MRELVTSQQDCRVYHAYMARSDGLGGRGRGGGTVLTWLGIIKGKGMAYAEGNRLTMELLGHGVRTVR